MLLDARSWRASLNATQNVVRQIVKLENGPNTLSAADFAVAAELHLGTDQS
jgi:hypothetical protein